MESSSIYTLWKVAVYIDIHYIPTPVTGFYMILGCVMHDFGMFDIY